VAAEPPIERLALRATSIADDLGFVALIDLAKALKDTESRVIGGHMVQLHVYRWGLGMELYRETQDADLGVPLMAAQDPSLVERLLAMGYKRLAGNRFGRPMDDIPVRGDTSESFDAVIDVLVPAYTSRPRSTRRIGKHLVTTEVPGLAEAFRRPAVVANLELTRMNGAVDTTCVIIPDELSALILKVMAWRARGAAKDAVDIWRCSEIALAAGVNAGELTGKTGAMVREELQRGVERREGLLMNRIVAYRRLSAEAGDVLHTRLRAVVSRLLGG
jgi:hypothetical protein